MSCGGSRTALAICVLALAGGLTVEAESPAEPEDTPASASGISRCTPGKTRTNLRTFIAAFNRGRYGRLDQLFAKEPQFQWYSSPPPGRRLGRAAKQRGTLVRYFRWRHRKRDRMRLTAFRWNGNSPRWGNFSFEGRRRAAGFNRRRWFRMVGKGALVCTSESARFIVMSLGSEPR